MKKFFSFSHRLTNRFRRSGPLQGLFTGSAALSLLVGLALCLSCATGFLFLKEITVAGSLLLFPLAVKGLTGTNA